MVTDLGPGAEFDLIRRFLAAGGAQPGPAVRVGAGDDCAVLTDAGVAISTDMIVEDVHFRREWMEPDEIGYHAAAAALSDLAAMAARPVGLLVSLALGPDDEQGPGGDLMAGIGDAARDAGATLLGGDLTRSPGPLVVDVVAVGIAERPVMRTGARPGHEVWVTGTLGRAARAVAAWLEGEAPDPDARRAFVHPTPRLEEAIWLAERSVPAAMIDLSDGIAGDAAHLAAASGVRLVIEAGSLPMDGEGGEESVRLAAAGGEDYELCFTAATGAVSTIEEEFRHRFGVALTRVGQVEEGEGAVVLGPDGEPLDLTGFQHWPHR